MRQIKIWLLDNPKIKAYIIGVILILTFFKPYIIDWHHDFFSPFIYLLLIIWVYYSYFYFVFFDEDTEENVILRRRVKNSKDNLGKFTQLTLLILMGGKSFLVFGKTGAVFSLCLITITALFILFVITKDVWKTKFNYKEIFDILGANSIGIAIVGYIFFIAWKGVFCYEFGVKEIGSYFEKDTYKAKYIVKISRVSGDEVFDGNIDEHELKKTYKLPADIIVSTDFSQYDDYEVETRYGEETRSSETKYAKIEKVYFNNGGLLYFSDCLIPINSSEICSDQNGEDWSVEITKEKVK